MNDHEKHIHRGNLKPERMPSEYEALRNDLDGIAKGLEHYSDTAVRHLLEQSTQIDRLWADNAALRDELHALANRVETLTRARLTEPAEVAERMLRPVPFKCPVPDCFIPDPHEHHADGHMIFRGAAS